MVLQVLAMNLITQGFVRIGEAYIDRARSSYGGSFKRNGVDLIEGRAGVCRWLIRVERLMAN